MIQQRIKVALKELLKKQGYTYADLAEVWDCSVPTVKRLLGQEELSLSRLLTLLDWLGLSLGELQKLAESEDLARPKYTAKQLEFLAKNAREFSFLMKLYDGMTPEQIARKYKMSAKVVERTLMQLEKFDLIRVGAGGKIKPSYAKVPGVDGPLARANMRRVIDRLSQFYKNRISEVLTEQERGVDGHRGGMTWDAVQISEKSYREFLSRFHKISEEITATAKIEERKLKKSELKVGVFSYGVFMCEQGDPNIRLIADLFDEGLSETPVSEQERLLPKPDVG
jgi:DNA-binding CsgD family transcriptional regulator